MLIFIIIIKYKKCHPDQILSDEYRTRQKRERKSVRRKQDENSRGVKIGEDGDSWDMVDYYEQCQDWK